MIRLLQSSLGFTKHSLVIILEVINRDFQYQAFYYDFTAQTYAVSDDDEWFSVYFPRFLSVFKSITLEAYILKTCSIMSYIKNCFVPPMKKQLFIRFVQYYV